MILSGKDASEILYTKLQDRISKLSFIPKLVAIQVGNSPASSTYLRIKQKKIIELGLKFELIKFEAEIEQNILLEKIKELNNSNEVHGIIVQLPLSQHLNERIIVDSVNPNKDVDCLTTVNLGNFFVGSGKILPATPLGVLRLLEINNIELTGKKVCVIGRSNLVGKPLAIALISRNATVTVCHSKTLNLQNITSESDIIISAVGNAKFLTKEFFNSGQIVVDVGTSLDSAGKLSGDVDFANVVKIVQSITPVPGGVGPMTVYGLMENLITLAEVGTLSA